MQHTLQFLKVEPFKIHPKIKSKTFSHLFKKKCSIQIISETLVKNIILISKVTGKIPFFNKQKNLPFMMSNITNRKLELRKSFLSAKTSDEMLKMFTKMESCFDEDELSLECLKLTNQLLKDGFLEKALLFGKRALKILLKNPTFDINNICQQHFSSLNVSYALQLLGNACLDLKLFDESLRYLNWASKNLSKIDLSENCLCDCKCILHHLLQVETLLLKVKLGLGCVEEIVVHLRKIVELKEIVMEEGCIEIGQTYKNLYGGYVLVGDFTEALPCCLKALEIYGKHFGRESVEAAEIMRDLGDIYDGLGEFEKRNEVCTLSMSILEKTGSYSTELLDAELEEGRVLIEMGRYEEALTVLRGVVSLTPADGVKRARAFLSMASAFCELGKFADARKYLKHSRKIFEQKELLSLYFATAYSDTVKLYEKMNEFEIAILLSRTALKMPEVPLHIIAECATRLFNLVFFTEKEVELITYLEDGVERLEDDFGPNHSVVGYSYARLGFAYFKLGQEELAVKLMANAKDVMDVSLGPCHLDSLRISQMLSFTYGTMKRYRLAIQIQEELIEGLKGLGQSQQEFMDEAIRLLNRMKGKVAEARTMASFQSKDGKDLNAKISNCCMSDDGMVTK